MASDTDWSQLIPGAVFGPLGAWLFIWLWVSRRVELDRSARTIRLVVTRKFRSGSDRTFAYHDIRELRAVGWRWLSIVMVTQDGPQVLAVVPRTTTYQQHARRIVSTLRSELGVPLDVSDETRRYWALE